MKLYVIGKKQMIKAGGVLLVLAALIVGTLNVFASGGGGRRLPIYCVETDKKQIAISFDAAWGNDDTENLIKILGDYNVKATFFVVAQWVERYPESVKQLARAGHSIQNHSSTHPQMSGLNCADQKKEIADCNTKIKNITGKQPKLFRPPYGDYNNDLIGTVEDMGMYTIQWDVEPLATVGTAVDMCFIEYFKHKKQPFKLINST